MDSIWIKGGKRLEGKIPISGAKNAALALLPCALLTEDKLTLGNLPRLASGMPSETPQARPAMQDR